ncbi:DUF1489 family protein [Profundibacterium mesophilum]|uniref:Lysophospholipase n=1 Tax=Profundibacterium mesophilum KAUST100406-0324 TaxID=1037889 RepID=A0A921TE20_9RHOB|nr:DUF1489 domain-containing protein [Profundibacterium mesophilum]KAF0676842.1 hypothetical protein PMES_00638 [Profundibacterium mesophilum KAUST100406-0324]
MAEHVNLLKLCVGASSVEELSQWQSSSRGRGPDGAPRHVTRMWPKRAEEILAGGSLYWVIKGVILARQRIVRLDDVDRGDGIRRCGLVLDPEICRTEAVQRRAFQGWRYLAPEDAPGDLRKGHAQEPDLPPALAAALAEIGVR